MLTSSHTQNLVEYFRRSGCFYYVVIDMQGDFVYVNPLFQQQFNHIAANFYDKKATSLLGKADSDKLKQVLQECYQNPDAASQVDFSIPSVSGLNQIIRWEFSAYCNEHGVAENIQAIGFPVVEPENAIDRIGHRIGEMAERYKAYEQSEEGLWKFELKVPIHQSPSPQELIDHCRKYSFLTECNDSMAHMYGYEKAEDFAGTSVADLLDFSDENRVEKVRQFIQNGFSSMLIETKEFDRFGNTKYFLNRMEGTIENGMLKRVWGTQQDITEQRLAEETNKYFGSIIEIVSDIIISQDKDLNIVSWNKAAENVYGYSAKEMIGRKINEVLHFEFQEISRPRFFELLHEKGEWDGEAYVVNRFGRQLTILTTITTVRNDKGDKTGYVSVSKDVTEKRKLDEQLKFQAGIYNNISDAINSSDMEFKITSWNKGAEEIYGLTSPEVLGKRVIDLVKISYHKTTRDEVIKTIFDKGVWKGEASFVRKSDQTKRTILSSITLQHDENGKPIGIVAVNKDITDRKKTEDQLRQQAAILSNVSDLIMTTDFNYNILSWNKKAEEVAGYSSEETIGKNLNNILRPDYGRSSPEQSAAELNEKGFWQGEISFFNKKGVKKHALHTASFLLDETGQRLAIIITGKDITERKKAEEQLEQSELFYRTLFANSLDGVLLTDEKGAIVFASPSITPILGYSAGEVLGKSTFDYAHPEDRTLALSAFMDELTDDAKHKFISVRLLKKSGEWMWCIIRGHNLTQNPYVKGMVVYFYDDTMRKETESALIKSEQRFRDQATVLNNVTDVIVTTDMKRVVTSWNKVIEKLTGISEKEAIGKPFRDIMPTNYSPYTNEQVAEIVFKEGIWRGEISFTGRNNEKVYLLHTISILYNYEGQLIGLLGVGKDITERKKAEARLQESEQFYRGMSYYSLDGIIMTDEAGKITYCGPSVERISGYAPAQLLGHNFSEFTHPADIPAASEAFIKEVNKQSVSNYIFLRLRHATNGWTWYTLRGHNLLDTPGFNSLVIYFTNDSKRKEAEDRLRKSEENFRNLIYNLKQGVILQDKNGMMTVCNQAALDMLGLTEDQLLGKASFDPSWNVIHEDGRNFPGYAHPVQVVLQTKKPDLDVVMGVYRPTTKDRVWLLVNAEPVFGSDGEIINVVCSFADITEQKRLSKELFEQEVQKQKQLTQATIDGQEKERQEIGKELHDNINQHLTTTRLYMEVAREKASGEVLDMINNSHKTLVGIINEIRLLSQSLVPPTLGDLGLVESVQELCDSLKKAHKFTLDFFFRYFSEEQLPDNLKLMLFRIIQEQVNNIVRHAQASAIQIKLQSDAEYIIITIADDGKGFDPANYIKGLGFKNIANRAGLFNGKVEIDAAPGKGCLLSVIIPLETSIKDDDLI